MGKFIDLTGMRFGRWEVESRAENDGAKVMWNVRCDCGNVGVRSSSILKSGKSRSCGCLATETKRAFLKPLDIIGVKFNMLTVLEDAGKENGGPRKAICKCDCGNIVTVAISKLKSGHTKSCGCITHGHAHNFDDLTGMRFGRLEVIEYSGLDKHGATTWKCKCDCGNISIVSSARLKGGHTKSCGCLRDDIIGNLNKTHGMTGTRLYDIYNNMMSRCYNKNNKSYGRYGGRGISVCDEWHTFEAFLAWSELSGYDDGLTIDRIDVNGDYCPENCRWADYQMQANNKRNSVYITVYGESHTARQWSEIKGVPYNLICDRFYRGWDERDLFLLPGEKRMYPTNKERYLKSHKQNIKRKQKVFSKERN